MSDKERLKMIKHDFDVREGFIEEYDVQWLIEKVENQEKERYKQGRFDEAIESENPHMKVGKNPQNDE